MHIFHLATPGFVPLNISPFSALTFKSSSMLGGIQRANLCATWASILGVNTPGSRNRSKGDVLIRAVNPVWSSGEDTGGDSSSSRAAGPPVSTYGDHRSSGATKVVPPRLPPVEIPQKQKPLNLWHPGGYVLHVAPVCPQSSPGGDWIGEASTGESHGFQFHVPSADHAGTAGLFNKTTNTCGA